MAIWFFEKSQNHYLSNTAFPHIYDDFQSMSLEETVKVLQLTWQCKREKSSVLQVDLKGQENFPEKKKNVMKLKHIYLSISIYASVFWAILSEQEERLRDRPFVVIHFHSSNSVTREWIFSTSHTIGGKQWVQGD